MAANLNLERGAVASQLQEPAPTITTLVMSERLTAEDCSLIDAALAADPALWLVAASEDRFPHLEFLADVPHASRADVRCRILSDLGGIRHGADPLRRLHLGPTQWPRTSLRPLHHAAHLDHVSLDGWATDLDVLADLPALHHLALRATRAKHTGFLEGCRSLRVLDWDLGRTKDVGGLGGLATVEYLRLGNASALEHLNGGLPPGLRALSLDSLGSLRTLPDLARLERLESVRISNCKVLKDLTPLLAAPALRYVSITRMTHLTADDVSFLRDHPRAPPVRLRLGTLEHTEAARETLGAQALAEGESVALPDLPSLPAGCWAFTPRDLQQECPA